MPNRTVLPPLLQALDAAGVPDHHITLLCATGTHRQATRAEMEELVGADIWPAMPSSTTTAGDDHVVVGEVDGRSGALQREYVDADVRIITGFVEPHFFAGFSGGPRRCARGWPPPRPSWRRITPAHRRPNATFVRRHGNPVHDLVLAGGCALPAPSVDRCDHR